MRVREGNLERNDQIEREENKHYFRRLLLFIRENLSVLPAKANKVLMKYSDLSSPRIAVDIIWAVITAATKVTGLFVPPVRVACSIVSAAVSIVTEVGAGLVNGGRLSDKFKALSTYKKSSIAVKIATSAVIIGLAALSIAFPPLALILGVVSVGVIILSNIVKAGVKKKLNVPKKNSTVQVHESLGTVPAIQERSAAFKAIQEQYLSVKKKPVSPERAQDADLPHATATRLAA